MVDTCTHSLLFPYLVRRYGFRGEPMSPTISSRRSWRSPHARVGAGGRPTTTSIQSRPTQIRELLEPDAASVNQVARSGPPLLGDFEGRSVNPGWLPEP